MSLYGGIKLANSKLAAKPTSASPTPTSTAESSSTSQSKDQPLPPSTDQPKPSNWSAALRFAPTQRKKPISTPSRPLSTAFSTSLDDDEPTTEPIPSTSRIVKAGKAALNVEPIKRPPPSKWGAASSMAGQEAVLLEAKAKAAALAASASAGGGGVEKVQKRTSGGPVRVRRIIQIPPSMTIEDEVILPTATVGGGGDVNGFASSAAGIKLAKETERKNNKNNKRGKKRKGGGNGAGEDPALRYGEIPYDPARPCDYAGYKTHIKLLRAQRRLEREEEERQRRRREGSGSDQSSYYSEDEEEQDEASSTKRARFFAPPTSYDDAPSFPPPSDSNEPFTPAPSLSAPSRNETADEA
ncbi:hypothetical protein JCM5353_008894, partial [Sporobolomyces roseus]